MEMMRIFVIFIFVCSLLFFTAPAYAQVDLCPGGNFANLCIEATSTGTIVSNVLQILIVLAMVLAVIFLVWGGVKWITAGGDKAGIEAARSTMTAAIVGLLLAFLAFFIFNFILYLFGVTTTGKFKVPTLTQ